MFFCGPRGTIPMEHSESRIMRHEKPGMRDAVPGPRADPAGQGLSHEASATQAPFALLLRIQLVELRPREGGLPGIGDDRDEEGDQIVHVTNPGLSGRECVDVSMEPVH